MIVPILLLGVISFALSWILTLTMKRVAPRLGFVDKPGGRKIHANPKPLLGGVAIFWAFVLPMIAGLIFVHVGSKPAFIADATWSGIHQQTSLAIYFIVATVILHAVGIRDDRKALGPYSKLIVQLGVTTLLVILGDVRALTALGYVPSVILTVLWITAITNAFNFLDNMDGLSAGVAAIATTAFLVTALSIEQWFVATSLALLLGALLGFLCFNFPPASIFMGDCGSLVIGFILGVLTIRTTYLRADHCARGSVV